MAEKCYESILKDGAKYAKGTVMPQIPENTTVAYASYSAAVWSAQDDAESQNAAVAALLSEGIAPISSPSPRALPWLRDRLPAAARESI